MTKKTVILNNGGVPVFDTSMIQDELEVVQSVYPQADVVLPSTVDAPTSSAAGSVTLDMLVQWSGRTTAPKVTVAVDLVYGYPFVLPNISVVVHNHTSALRGEKDNDAALRDVEAVVQSRLTVSIRDATSAAVSAGQPCLLLLLAHVEEFFSQDPPPQRVAPSFDDMSVGSRDHLVPAAATKKSVAFSAPLPDDAVKAQQKQLRRLAALTLHMTQKCCELYSKESSEEANDNFLFLKQYLTDDVAIVPKEISERWDARKMLKAGFSSFVENSEESEDVRLCLKWFWGTSTSTESTTLLANRGDETAFTFDQRFAHDFIQQRRIGAGGFAPVFICRKIIDGKLYAVKKVAVLTHQSARALREVQMLAALDHENIVRYYDAWAEPGVDKDLASFVVAIEDEAAEEEDEEDSDTTCTDSSDSEVSDASEAEEEEEDDEVDEGEYDDEEEHSSQAPSQCDEAMRLPPSSQKPPLRSAAASFFDSDSDDDDDDLSTGDRNGCSAQSTPALGSTTTHTSASSSRRSKDGVSVRQKSTNDGPSSHRLFSEDHSSMNGTSAYQRYRTLYIQMELCEAATLRHLIDSGKLLEDNGGEQLAASIFRQLLMVVAHVHSQQVVHRDLKPDNVLFQHQQHGKAPGHRGAAQANAEVFFGAIKVADFGLARSMPKSLMRSKSADMDELTSNERAAMSPISTGAGQFFHLRGATSFDENTTSPPKVQVTTNCGTVLYCAPEQADGSTYDHKVDDYSVGMIALEMWLAVAGRDFRERFIILNQVTRAQGVLPIWFQQWRPKIAEIISSLLQFQPKKRSTCESILTRQDLPGEPTEIAQALHTLAQYGPKMVGRVFQRLEEHALASFRRRPVPHAAAAADSLKSTPLQVQHVMEMAAVLHCATQLPFIEPLLPLAPPLKTMLTTSRSDGSRTSAGNSVLMDDHGKCYIASSFPQLSAASFLATHRTAFQENSFTFHYNKTGRPSFNFGTLQTPTTMDIVLQPILFTLDVLSRIELSEGSRLIMTLFARSDRAQSTLSFEDESGRGECDPALESKPPQRSRQHVASLEDLRDYLAAHEQDFSPDDLHELKFIAAAIFNAAPQMFRCTTDMPLVFVSAKWSMEEDEALVDASMLTGIVVSCEVMTTGGIASTSNANSALASTTAGKESSGDGKKVNHASGKKAPPPATSSPLGQGSAGRSHTSAIIAAASTPDDDKVVASSSTLVAVGCHLLPFAALFNPYHDTHAFMMSFDLAAMQTVTRRVIKRLLNAATILDGVVVSAGDGASDASGGGGPAVPQLTAPSSSGGGSGTPVHVPTSTSSVALRMPSSCSVGGGGVTPDLVVMLAKLLAAGHRIFPRGKIGTKDVSAFKESSPGRQHSWWITEALKLLWIPSVVNHKANRHEVRHEVHMETIVRDVRTIMAAAAVPGAINPHTHAINMGGILGAAGASTVAVTTSSGGASGSTSSFTMPTSMKVDFTGREDSNAVLEARENLIHLLSVVHQSSIIAVACTSSEVRRCFIDFMDAYDRTPASSSISIGAPPSTADAGGSSTISPSLVPRSGSAVGVQGFVDWLKRHFVSTPMCMVPVFCLVDKRLEILVHHQRLKQSIRGKLDPPNKKNGNNGGHKKNGKYT